MKMDSKGGESLSLPINFSLTGGWGNVITYSVMKRNINLLKTIYQMLMWPPLHIKRFATCWKPRGAAHGSAFQLCLWVFAGVRRSLFFTRWCVSPHTNGLWLIKMTSLYKLLVRCHVFYFLSKYHRWWLHVIEYIQPGQTLRETWDHKACLLWLLN